MQAFSHISLSSVYSLLTILKYTQHDYAKKYHLAPQR